MVRQIDTSAGRKLASMEKIVRDFLGPQRRTFGELAAKPPPIEEDNEDILRWGGPQEFNDPRSSQGFTINSSAAPEEPGVQEQQTITYNEVSRQTQQVRVVNPQDSNQWVDVVRITGIKFRGSDGFDHQFELNW